RVSPENEDRPVVRAFQRSRQVKVVYGLGRDHHVDHGLPALGVDHHELPVDGVVRVIGPEMRSSSQGLGTAPRGPSPRRPESSSRELISRGKSRDRSRLDGGIRIGHRIDSQCR
ncbi:hypothetical protein RRG08_058196, partial [Elysia crispata]